MNSVGGTEGVDINAALSIVTTFPTIDNTNGMAGAGLSGLIGSTRNIGTPSGAYTLPPTVIP